MRGIYKDLMRTLSFRLTQRLARQVKSKARASRTTVSAVARELFAQYVSLHKADTTSTAMQQHIDAHARSWDGHCSGEELLRRTRG
jgi:hypothetical protein